VRAQLDRFEDNQMAVLLLYPEGRGSFDAPGGLLSEDPRAGAVFAASFAHDREETRRMAAENRRLLDELPGRDDV